MYSLPQYFRIALLPNEKNGSSLFCMSALIATPTTEPSHKELNIRCTKTVKRNWSSIMNNFCSRITDGISGVLIALKVTQHTRAPQCVTHQKLKKTPRIPAPPAHSALAPTLTLTSESPAPRNDEQSRTMIPLHARKSQTSSDRYGETSTSTKFASDG